jgi:hypothetical protein
MSPEHMVACTLRTHLPLELNKSGATKERLLEVVSYSIKRIDTGHPGAVAALPGEYKVPGVVTVRCRSQAQEPADILLGLLMDAESVKLNISGLPLRSELPTLQIYADEQLTVKIPTRDQADPRHWFPVRVPAQAEIQLQLPFFGKLMISRILPAGNYVGASNIALKVQMIQ